MTESPEYIDCPNCSRPVKADAKVCGHCWTKFQGETVRDTSRPGSDSPPKFRSEIAALTVRYRDAYAVASTIMGFGGVVKAIGVLLAGIVVLASLATSNDLGGGRAVLGGLLLGAWIGGIIYLLGILTSAQGQILRATLDTAVNTSPLLDHEHRIGLIKN